MTEKSQINMPNITFECENVESIQPSLHGMKVSLNFTEGQLPSAFIQIWNWIEDPGLKKILNDEGYDLIKTESK